MGKTIRDHDLSDEDMRALELMIRDPVGNDVDIAKKAGLGLSTFRRTKERIMSKSLCRRAFVPEITKMDFELVVFTLLKLNPSRNRSSDIDHIKSLVSPWPFILMSRKSKALIGHCFSNFTSYEKYSSRVLKDLKRGSIHLDTIQTISCSTASMREIKALDFSGIIPLTI